MGFEGLLGNEQLKTNLSNGLKAGKSAHFYLITGPAGSGKRTLARLLAASAMCQEAQRPCLRCNACRKVMAGSHPDVISVVDPEHKSVAVKLVRQFREDAFIRPNEGAHKVYIFPQELGTEGQNALLKLLEEPPDYGVFLLLSENPEKLLSTVRSRCAELALQPLPPALLEKELRARFPDAQPGSIAAVISRSGGFLGQAIQLLQEGSGLLPQTEQFAQAFAQRQVQPLLQTLCSMEKWKRDALLTALEQWLRLLTEGLSCRAGVPSAEPLAEQLAKGRSASELLQAVQALQKAIRYAQGNVSPGAICGWLIWQLR